MRFFKPIELKASAVRSAEVKKLHKCLHEKSLKLTLAQTTQQVKDSIKYSILYRDQHGKWLIANNETTTQIPSGAYTFVVSKQGVIRVEPRSSDGISAHSMLSACANEVAYAGDIFFADDNSGKLLSWNNQSGSYSPDALLFPQAKLPAESFKPFESIEDDYFKHKVLLGRALQRQNRFFNKPAFISKFELDQNKFPEAGLASLYTLRY